MGRPGPGCEFVARGSTYLRPPACDLLTGGLAHSDRELYVDYSTQLINGEFSSAAMNARIDALGALIANDISADPNVDGAEQWATAVAGPRSIVDAKRQFIAGRL